MYDEIENMIETDNICFREKMEDGNHYQTQLAHIQREKTEQVFQFMKEKYGIKLKVFEDVIIADQDPSIEKLRGILDSFDIYAVTALNQMC